MSTVYRNRVPEHLQTTDQLRRSGLRPGDPAVAGGWLERVFEGDVWRTALYDVRSARPLSPPTPAPRWDSLPVHGFTPNTPPEAGEDEATWARRVLRDPSAVILDTETTDYHGRVIEIAVLATDGTVLLDTLVDPEGAVINPKAQQTHGITAAMLVGAPTMAQLWPRLDELLRDRPVIAWNAPFDQGRLRAEHQQVMGGTAQPAWLAGAWECAMRRHAAWAGDRNSRGTGFRNHKLEGGHRAAGDCRAALDRLRSMANSLPAPPSTAVGQAGTGPDAHAMREAWPRVLEQIRRHSRSAEAMLTNVVPDLVEDRTLIVRHQSAPIARRLAEERNLGLLRDAVAAVTGPGWNVHVEASGMQPSTSKPVRHRARPSLPAPHRPRPAVPIDYDLVDPDGADAHGGKPYHDWQDCPGGMNLESWICIDPSALCPAVVEPQHSDSANARAMAFYDVNHTAHCAPDAMCRAILRLAEEGRFEEAENLAEDHVLGA
ncbi:exonuclease domain-containing protein [Saccharothrix lopnurensis]|uniref:Exonuclease domain-containing protein n=1 Tax=Saccharothrix lopnurensis TaxID=1670621 RepID=A0ABW1NYS2_9PSEU